MSKELVETLLKQAEILTTDEKIFLANRLLEQVKMLDITDSAIDLAEDEIQLAKEKERSRRNLQMKWLKEHQVEYGGRYVALDGEFLVGCGNTYREVVEIARKTGVRSPLIVHVPNTNVEYFAGW